MADNLAAKLEQARVELLDLSLRNRLINTSRTSSRSSRLEIIEELSDQVYDVLVGSGRQMSFAAAPEQEVPKQTNREGLEFLDDLHLRAQPDDILPDDLAERQSDTILQTDQVSRHMQRKLLGRFWEK